AQRERHRNVTISTDDEKLISDCGQIRMEIGDLELVRSELSATLPGSSSSLRITAARNGGIHVQGWDHSDYQIKACIAAAGETTDAARELAAQLKLTTENGQVTVSGPSKGDWLAYLVVQAPRGAALELSSTNGPIGISDVSGNIEAKNINGPLTFTGVNGNVRGDVQNGPITVTGGGGDYKLEAQNGPLTVVLESGQWTGGQLEGRTQNGPLTLNIADGFQSSVLVEASKHSPVNCYAGPCSQANRTWDQPNIIRFGESD